MEKKHTCKYIEMIDNITLTRDGISEIEKNEIIEKNNLQSFINESTGIRNYNNKRDKNLTGGILIDITGNKLKIEGSIHKYFHFLHYRSLENYTVFTMADFRETITILFKDIGIIGFDFYLKNYEIGLNVMVGDTDPNNYLKKAVSIGRGNSIRKLYFNPRYKNESFKTTQMHKDNSLIFRLYDKDFERKDKGKTERIPPCLRIETKRTRQNKLSFTKFCSPSNLTILQNSFFAEWQTLNFEREISALPGTHQTKKEVAKRIIAIGKNAYLEELEYKRNSLTPKIFRSIKEFTNNWENEMLKFNLINSAVANSWEYYYNIALQQVTKIKD